MNLRVLVFVPMFLFSVSAYGVKPATDVNVINDATSAVPVTQQGPVIIGNDALSPVPVIVGNDALNPVAVISGVAARTPYQETVLDTTWAAQQVTLNFSALSLDERLVIEHISAVFSMAPNEELSSYILTLQLDGASSATHRIDIPPEGAPGFTGSRIYNGGQAARLYTDQAPVVRAIRVLISGSSTAFARAAGVTISGYKIPRTSPSLAP